VVLFRGENQGLHGLNGSETAEMPNLKLFIRVIHAIRGFFVEAYE
jgi:hypothetical protein